MLNVVKEMEQNKLKKKNSVFTNSLHSIIKIKTLRKKKKNRLRVVDHVKA